MVRRVMAGCVQVLTGLNVELGGFSARTTPATLLTCASIKAVTKGALCTEQHLGGLEVRPVSNHSLIRTCRHASLNLLYRYRVLLVLMGLFVSNCSHES